MQPVHLPLEDRDTVAERLSTQVEQIKVAMKKNDDREIWSNAEHIFKKIITSTTQQGAIT